MERPTPLNPVPFVALFVIGAGTLFHFSQHVRSVDAVGLSGSGFALGVAVFAFIIALRARNKV
jgi:hypothetical protein